VKKINPLIYSSNRELIRSSADAAINKIREEEDKAFLDNLEVFFNRPATRLVQIQNSIDKIRKNL
jgi:hypothetical protein